MKKVLTMLAVGAIVVSASADLTEFNWVGGVVTDQGGLGFATDEATAHTFLDVDLSIFVVDNAGQLQINIADIPSAYSIDLLGIAPPFLGATYGMSANVTGDGSIAGMIAYLVIKDGVDAIQAGDFIGLGASGTIVDLQPGDDPPSATQQFLGGDVQTGIEVVIPEPATFGLMGVAALGLFLARKKAHR